MYTTEYFDEEFFVGKTGKKGGDRVGGGPAGKNLGILRGVADVIKQVFHGKSFIDVGCGVGHVVHYLQSAGENACGIELAEYAVKRAVANNIIQGDIRDLFSIETKYDVVICWNVLAYLEEKDIESAVNSLKHLSREHIVLAIVTSENVKKRPYGAFGRLTIKHWNWWMAQFKKYGLEQDKETARTINKLGGGWRIFCLRKIP